MKEHYVSYEIAQRLNALGFDLGTDKYYCTEDFCQGNNPISFDTYSVGDLVDEVVVYYVNDDNEEEMRGIPAPRLDQAQAWLREAKGIALNIIAHYGGKYHWSEVYLPNFKEKGYEWYAYREHPLMDSYELALSAGIDEALKLLEKGDPK